MTKEEFLSLIRTPDEVIQQRPEAIASLVKEFPYCQALRYFYLLQLHGQNHISYAQQLKLSSAYAPDRKRLHQLIHPELMTHDSVAWNENIALENEGMIDTSSEKKEVSSVDIVDVPSDETIGTIQNHRAEIIEETPFDTSEIPSPKEIEEETKEVQSDEDDLSAEEIVIQRLKELNIWTEPETISPKVEVNFQDVKEVETEGLNEIEFEKEKEIEEEEEIEKEIEEEKEKEEETNLVPHGMIEENDDPDLEEEIEKLELLSEKHEEEIKVETKSAASKEKELDPIEELILENIVTSQVNNSDYFSEEKQDNIVSTEFSEDEHLSERNLDDIPVATLNITQSPIEPIPHQAGEVHSFAEWLHLNQKTESKREENSDTSKKEVRIETPTPNVQPSMKTDEKTANNSPTVEVQLLASRASASEKDLLTSRASELASRASELASRASASEKDLLTWRASELASRASASEKDLLTSRASASEQEKNSGEEIPKESRAEKSSDDLALNAPKMLYVKSTSSQPSTTPASHQKETSAPHSSPSVPTEKIPFSTISNTPLDTDPNLIPPKKPIPDPSLVDTDPPKSKVPTDQLIDKFIKQEPRITPSKSAFYSPINMAKRSIIESDDIVSETLANIYAQQGNFQKAISFYTKLSLRFPEKSRYFAALIKELENKLNT